ncbi:uncharacterized protein LOC118318777 isoform X2 [Scophthalmus maximus]|nr:uncharacterized protein LOC118318777 isoform X2 [Scophthalmus maximus]
MTSAVLFITFIFIICSPRCESVAVGHSVSFSVVFSEETQLMVLTELTSCDEDHHHHHPPPPLPQDIEGPSVQVLSSLLPPQDAGRRLLLCLVSGLTSPLQHVLWWVDDTVLTAPAGDVSLVRSDEEGGAYSATSVLEVSAADWRSGSTFWCGTVQEGRVHRRRLIPQTVH